MFEECILGKHIVFVVVQPCPVADAGKRWTTEKSDLTLECSLGISFSLKRILRILKMPDTGCPPKCIHIL